MVSIGTLPTKGWQLIARMKGIFLLPLLSLLFFSSSLHSQIVINEILADGTVELKNIGNSADEVGTYFLCQFPSYEQINDLNIICGTSFLAPGEIVAIDNFSGLDGADGELALYLDNSFSSAASIIDYVEWGSSGHQRATVAAMAGIWTMGDFVPAFTGSLEYSGAGNGVDSWTAQATSSICEDNSGGNICTAEGGEITTSDATEICVGDGIADPIDITLTGNTGTNSAWVITDTDGNVLALPAGPPFDLDGAGVGVCLIWHLSYEDGITGVGVGNNASDLAGCFALSNPITVTRVDTGGPCDMGCMAEGGEITTSDATEICAGDGIADPIDVTLTGNTGANSAWVITDTDGNILALPAGPPFDLDGAGVGVCLIWHLSFEDGLEGAAVGNNASDLTGCFALSNPITVTRVDTGGPCDMGCMAEGGEITTSDATEICAGDGIADPIDVTLTGNTGANSAWVITDADGNILALPAGPPFDLDGAGAGVCLIWHLSFEDGLEGAAVGNNASELTGCFDLSNPITVTRTGVNGGDLTALSGNIYNRVVVANRASGTISVINSDNNQVEGSYPMPEDGEPMYVVYNNANNTVLVGDYNGKVAAFDGKTFEHTGSADAGSGVFHMWLSPDNQQLWVNNELDKTISVINPNTLENIATISIPTDLLDLDYKPHDVILMPNNAAAFVTMLGGTEDDYVVKYSTTTFEETERAMVGADPHVSLTDANDKLYVASQGADEVKVLNRSDLSEVTTISVPNAHGMGMNKAGTYLYVGNISDGGNDATYTIDLSADILLTDTGVDAPYSAPHNYAVTAADSKLFVTHSGANNKVSIYDLDPIPTLATSLTVGNNPFGLVAYTYVETTDELSICAGDGTSDAFNVILENEEGTNSAWVITDVDGNILGLPASPPFDLDGAGVGTCLIWHLSYEDGLEGAAIGNNASDLTGCFNLSNPVTVNRYGGETIGGEITTMDATEICAGDGVADPINVTLTGNVGTNSAWVITNLNGNILGLPAAPPFDLEGAGEGVCQIWHLSYEDGLVGVGLGLNAYDLEGCYSLSNPINVTRNGVNGGDISTTDPTEICAGDGVADPINVSVTNVEGANSAWVITDADGNILALPAGPPFDLDGAGAGVCLIWHLSFEDGLEGAAVGNNASELTGCFDLSNPITVTRTGVNGGEIATDDPTTICVDGVGDPINVALTGAEGTNSAWVITDTDGNILGLPAGPPFDLDGAGVGVCLIWHLSFEDGLEGAAVGNNASDLTGCFALSNPITVTRVDEGGPCDMGCMAEGGTIATEDPTEICAGDGIADPIDVTLTGNTGANSAWVITDADGNILALPAGPPFDLDGAGAGVCLIWHLSFEDGLEGAAVGNNASELTGCFALSNPITVTRTGVNGGEIATDDPTTICVDGVGDPINVALTGAEGTNSAWVITDTDGNILGLPAGPPFDLDGAGVGVCLIWHLSFEDGLEGAAVGNNASDLTGCFALSNPITVTRVDEGGPCDMGCMAEGGTIATEDPTEICAGDGIADPIDVTLTGNTGANSAWVITDADGNILALPAGPPFDLDGAGAGVCLIWHLSFEDGLEGAAVGNNASELTGCFALSNPITVTRTGVNGGEIATDDPTTICVDGVGDPINVALTGAEGTNSAWVITDTDGNILGLPAGPPFDLDGAGVGVCLIWHLSFEDGLEGAAVGNNASDLTGCFALSNPITVTRVDEGGPCDMGCMAEGGTIATEDPTEICAGDGIADPIDVTLTGNTGANSAWVITDADGNILALPAGPPFDLDGAGAGVCLIWHLSFEDGLEGAAVGNNASELTGCFALSNPITVTRTGVNGGEIATDDPTTICVDGVGDPINVALTGAEGTNSAWVITDTDGNILGLPAGPPFDLDGAGVGVCLIWHLSFEDGLEGAAVGNNASDLTGCFALSNPITVTRVDEGGPCDNGGIGADLNLSISVDQSLYDQYQGIVYTITLINEGDEDATGIVVSAPLPDGMVYSEDDTDTGDYSLFYEEWEVGDLDAGETAVLYLDLYTLVEDENIVNFVEVVEVNEVDPDSAPNNGDGVTPNEDDEAVITITPLGGGGAGNGDGSIDLELSVEADVDAYEIYEHVIYTYTLTNNGADDASNIFVNVPLSDGTAYSDHDESEGHYSLWRERWEIEELEAGETITLELDVFTLFSEVDLINYAEVFAAEQQDVDSTPNNGDGVTANEDDEATLTLGFLGFNGQSPNVNALTISGEMMLINSVYPNPAIDYVNLNISSAKEKNATINIVNRFGQIVHQEQRVLDMGITSLQFDVTALAPGEYYIQLLGVAGYKQAKPFVKVK